jgi:hypothetical protein
VIRLDGMTERKLSVDLVVRAAPVSAPRNHSSGFQLTEDSLYGSLRDANRLCDLAYADIGITGYAHQYVPVIAKKSPGWGAGVNAHGSTSVIYYIKQNSRIDKRETDIML